MTQKLDFLLKLLEKKFPSDFKVKVIKRELK